MRLGIFGGTFDPIHRGHLEVARSAKKQFALDKVIFVPAFIPPHKAARRDLTPAPYRYRMAEIAVSGEKGFEISSLELNRPDVSYTVETLRALKEKNPGAEIFLILGTDSLAEFSSWREPEEILKLATIVVAPRENGEHSFPPAKGVEWIQMPVCRYSSSSIREMVARGENVEAMLPRGVGDYINQMKLYSGK